MKTGTGTCTDTSTSIYMYQYLPVLIGSNKEMLRYRYLVQYVPSAFQETRLDNA